MFPFGRYLPGVPYYVEYLEQFGVGCFGETASSPGVVLRRKEARALISLPSVKGESSGVTSNCRGVRLLVGVGVLSG